MKIAELLVPLEELEKGEVDLPLNIPAETLADLVSGGGQEKPSLKGPLVGGLKLSLTGEHLRLKGEFKAKAAMLCDRCLNEAETELEGRVDEVLLLRPEGQTADENDDSVDGEVEVSSGQIDLAPLMAEFFWLAWPFRFICRDDCAGLCARCGADLNNGPCACGDQKWN